MNVPVRGGAGRMNATIPLASLVIDEDAVTLAPRWFAAAMVGPFRVPLREVLVAYRLRSSVLTSGIGIDTRDGQTAYFWTLTAQEEVLATLARSGVCVDPLPRPRAAQRRTRSSPPATVPGAPLRPWLVRALPLGMVAATILMIVFELRSAPLVWHIWIAFVWVVGLMTSLRMWRSSRHTN
jgi:hypothetical protein